MKWEIVPDVVLGPAVCSLSPLCKNCFWGCIYLRAVKVIVSTFFFYILSSLITLWRGRTSWASLRSLLLYVWRKNEGSSSFFLASKGFWFPPFVLWNEISQIKKSLCCYSCIICSELLYLVISKCLLFRYSAHGILISLSPCRLFGLEFVFVL